jgi:general secretion pathway protein N
LLGTVAGARERIGLFIDSGSKEVLRLKAGENHQGWTLRNVRPRQVELAKGLDSTVLDLAPPDLKPGPAAPMLAGSLPGGPLPASAAKPSIGSSPSAGLVSAFKPSGTVQAAPNSAVKRALEASQSTGSPSLQQRSQ